MGPSWLFHCLLALSFLYRIPRFPDLLNRHLWSVAVSTGIWLLLEAWAALLLSNSVMSALKMPLDPPIFMFRIASSFEIFFFLYTRCPILYSLCKRLSISLLVPDLFDATQNLGLTGRCFFIRVNIIHAQRWLFVLLDLWMCDMCRVRKAQSKLEG